MALSASRSGGLFELNVRLEQEMLMCTRNFLLFLPGGVPNLRAVLSYYAATANVTHEGDVHINDTLQGLGKYNHFLPTCHPNILQ